MMQVVTDLHKIQVDFDVGKVMRVVSVFTDEFRSFGTTDPPMNQRHIVRKDFDQSGRPASSADDSNDRLLAHGLINGSNGKIAKIIDYLQTNTIFFKIIFPRFFL